MIRILDYEYYEHVGIVVLWKMGIKNSKRNDMKFITDLMGLMATHISLNS